MEGKGTYSKSDDILIDELVFNFKMIEMAKADLLTRGQILEPPPGSKPLAYDIVNKSIDIYNTSLKNMTNLFVRLGISPKERIALKIEMTDSKDEFDEAFPE